MGHPPTYYNAFGESKTTKEWAVDARCAVSYSLLRGRLQKNAFGTTEEAVKTPARYGSKPKIKPLSLSVNSVSVGDVFGQRTITAPKVKRNKTEWLHGCVCSCGNHSFIRHTDIVRGTGNVCAECAKKQRETTFSVMAKARPELQYLRQSHSDMLYRCYNKKCSCYASYGGRGIKVCTEWQSLDTFVSWALTHGWEKGLTIERVNVNGNYAPSNCSWETIQVQNGNKRCTRRYTYNGKSLMLSEWENQAECVVIRGTLYSRLANGWPFAKALTTPATVPEKYTYWGETHSILEWSQDSRCTHQSKAVLQSRLRDGMPFERAMTLSVWKGAHVTCCGETKLTTEWTKDARCSVSTRIIGTRLRAGWPPEEALFWPLSPGSSYESMKRRYGKAKNG